MTVNQLYKLLGKLIEEGHGRREVCVDKPSFTHPLEANGVVYQDIRGAHTEVYEICDGDGFMALDSKGRVRTRTGVLLYGKSGPTSSVGRSEDR